MTNTDSNSRKSEKPRRPKSAPPIAWSLRRKSAAILAASLALAVAALVNGIGDKFSGNRNSPATGTSSASGAAYLVTDVPDGDTLLLRASSGKETRVRLYGVDAPELHQKGGKAAMKFASSHLGSERVSLRVMDEDRYGRAVALVILKDGRVLNEELVRAGHAWVERVHCREEPTCSNWNKYERLAQKERRGLWRDGNPLPPWKWREQNPRK